jgi:hypothetical protein
MHKKASPSEKVVMAMTKKEIVNMLEIILLDLEGQEEMQGDDWHRPMINTFLVEELIDNLRAEIERAD